VTTIKRIRRVSEDEAIAIFLKGEFHYPEFDRDRERFASVVNDSAGSGRGEAEMRKRLLYRRRGHVWRELPADTQWWQVEVDTEDVRKMNVFTRRHWPRMNPNDHSVAAFAEGMRSSHVSRIPSDEVTKILSLQQKMTQGYRGHEDILLVGVDERQPATILEGNNRIIAAYLADPGTIPSRFRFFLGISLSMSKCIFYRHTPGNFRSYLWHRLVHATLYPLRGFVRREAYVEGESN
jgi:hypothetical protein